MPLKKLFHLMFGMVALNHEANKNKHRSKIEERKPSTTQNKRLIPKGAKLFVIDGREYVALNEKNATRKHNNYLKSIKDGQDTKQSNNMGG